MNVRSFANLFNSKNFVIHQIADELVGTSNLYRHIKSVEYDGNNFSIRISGYYEENHDITLGEFMELFLNTEQEFMLIDQDVSFKTKGVGRMPIFLHLHKKYLNRRITKIEIDPSNPSVIGIHLEIDIEELFEILS